MNKEDLLTKLMVQIIVIELRPDQLIKPEEPRVGL